MTTCPWQSQSSQGHNEALAFDALLGALEHVALPADARQAEGLRPWQDLATAALLANTGELRTCSRRHLDAQTLGRLQYLVGTRPQHYWDDLIHYGQTLSLFTFNEQCWDLKSQDSEILGATRRECSPALFAAWLRQPADAAALAVVTDDPLQQMSLRMELISVLKALPTGKWYPVGVLGHVLEVAAQKKRLTVATEQALEVAPLLAKRVLRILSLGVLDEDNTHFMLRDDTQTPTAPTPPSTDASQTKAQRAAAFRNILASKLSRDDAWKQVQSGLKRCVEVRRERTAPADSLSSISGFKARVRTDPRMPFKDCLFLTRLGRLVPEGTCCQDSDQTDAAAPGSYVFEIDIDALTRSIKEGMPLNQIQSFLQERCQPECYERLRGLLQQAEAHA